MKYDKNTIEQIINTTKKYEAKDCFYPAITLISNIIFLFVCIYGLYIFKNPYYITFMVILTSLIILRNFMIFHDLGHGNYFPSDERETNKIGVNRFLCDLLDFLYYYPGKDWMKTHTSHHKSHGNIDVYDEARTLITTEQYKQYPYYIQKLYDIIRHPLLFFIISPLYIFNIARLVNVNLIFLLKIGLFLYLIKHFTNMKTLVLLLISYYIAGIIGVILFHLQHALNEPSWSNHYNEDDKQNAELNGSTVISVPTFLKPFTNGIEYHNVHHINPGVPSYNIQKCYEELKKQNLLKNHEYSLYEAFEGLSHTLYDVEKNKYVYHYNK